MERTTMDVVNELLGEKLLDNPVNKILATKFRGLVAASRMTAEKWDNLMARFIVRKATADMTAAEMQRLRIGWETDFLTDDMDWETFVAGIEFLGADVATIFFTLLTHTNESSAVSATIRFPK